MYESTVLVLVRMPVLGLMHCTSKTKPQFSLQKAWLLSNAAQRNYLFWYKKSDDRTWLDFSSTKILHEDFVSFRHKIFRHVQTFKKFFSAFFFSLPYGCCSLFAALAFKLWAFQIIKITSNWYISSWIAITECAAKPVSQVQCPWVKSR